MAAQTTLRGLPVATATRNYSPFTDRETGELRPGGVTRLGYIVTSITEQPVEVKFSGPEAEGLFGEFALMVNASERADVRCDLYARGNQISHVAREVVESAG